MTWWTVGFSLIAYVVGSLPFGYWVGLSKGVDVRREGSGNIGATNVWRVLGAKAGMAVLVLDVLKGFAPAFWLPAALSHVARTQPTPEYGLLFGTCAIIGHVASPFLGFRGGKAVATSLGVILALTPWVGLVGLLSFFAVFIATRYVSLASLAGAAAAAVSVQFLSDSLWVRVTYVLVALLLVYRHRSNISRLMRGEERRFELSRLKSSDGGRKDALA